jgi:hypothetical protein
MYKNTIIAKFRIKNNGRAKEKKGIIQIVSGLKLGEKYEIKVNPISTRLMERINFLIHFIMLISFQLVVLSKQCYRYI